MNDHLEALLVAQAAGNQTSVANLVGKDILYKTDKVTIGAEGGSPIYGDLKGKAATVTATISDANGKAIRTITVPGGDSGPVALSWDGMDSKGVAMPPGTYSVKLTASDIGGASVDIDSRGRAHSTGVTFANGYPELLLGDVRVRLSDVVEINEPQTTSTAVTNKGQQS